MKTSKNQVKTTFLSFALFILLTAIIFTIFGNISYSQNSNFAANLNQTGVNNLTVINNVTEVNLANKNLSSVPEIVFQMTSLETLDLHDNPIQTIPDDIRKLQNLRVLDLTGTEITELPEEISHLMHLQEIHLNYEQWELKLDKVKKLTRAAIILE